MKIKFLLLVLCVLSTSYVLASAGRSGREEHTVAKPVSTTSQQQTAKQPVFVYKSSAVTITAPMVTIPNSLVLVTSKVSN